MEGVPAGVLGADACAGCARRWTWRGRKGVLGVKAGVKHLLSHAERRQAAPSVRGVGEWCGGRVAHPPVLFTWVGWVVRGGGCMAGGCAGGGRARRHLQGHAERRHRVSSARRGELALEVAEELLIRHLGGISGVNSVHGGVHGDVNAGYFGREVCTRARREV